MARDLLAPQDKIYSSSDAPDDDSPDMDEWGRTMLHKGLTKVDVDETLDEDMPYNYEDPTDSQADEPPAEALADASYMAPLSDDEEEALETPFLQDDLSFVDDAEHEDRLIRLSLQGHYGMDAALDDVVYGESPSRKHKHNRTKRRGSIMGNANLTEILGDDYETLLGDSERDYAKKFLNENPSELPPELRKLRRSSSGEDSLGAFATEILGDTWIPGTSNPSHPIQKVSGSGAWLHKLNPSYWTKSARERHLIDIEKDRWIQNAKLQKREKEQAGELQAGQRALVAAQTARAAQDESQASEEELKQIEQSLSGVGSSFVGADAAIAQKAARNGRRAASSNAQKASALEAKIKSGEKLTSEDMQTLHGCIKTCGLLKQLHTELHAGNTTSDTVGRFLGIGKKKKSHEQKIRDARKASLDRRRKAAAIRAEAAAERDARAAQAEIDAANAEKSSADTEAAPEADASPPPPADGADDGAPPPPPDSDAGAFVGSWTGAVEDPKAKKIIAAAATNTPIGMKIRAGAVLYKKAAKGDPKARIAIAKIQQKAKAGHPQARKDLTAIKAGKIALTARGTAKKKIAHHANKEIRNKKGVAVRTHLENRLGDRLARVSRKKQLSKIAHVERQAAKGDKKAKVAIAHTVAKAAKGDPKAKATVNALKLARHVRQSTKTPAEARNLVKAHKVVIAARKGNPKAVQKIRILQAAARSGHPSAKREVARMQTAAKVETALSTGKVPAIASSKDKKVANIKQYNALKAKVATGAASREEATAAAVMAKKLNQHEEAAILLAKARQLKPAGDPIQKAAITARAAQSGDADAQAAVNEAMSRAQAGDPAGISAAGHLAAANAVKSVANGGTMSPQVAEATGIVERAKAGDPEAKRIIERAAAKAQTGDPSAVEATVALAAASTTLAALAAKPGAKAEWMSKAAAARGQKLDTDEERKAQGEFAGLYAKVHAGTATRAEAERARDLAMALGKPKLAAEVSAAMPPPGTGDEAISSLPDRPLEPIRNGGGLFKEAIKALFFVTRDPLQNYREGLQSRALTGLQAVGPMPTAPGGPKRVPGGVSGDGTMGHGKHGHGKGRAKAALNKLLAKSMNHTITLREAMMGYRICRKTKGPAEVCAHFKNDILRLKKA